MELWDQCRGGHNNDLPLSKRSGHRRGKQVLTMQNWWLVSLAIVINSISCGSSGDLRLGVEAAPGLELRTIRDKESCGEGCEEIAFDSAISGRSLLWVMTQPDFVLGPDDIFLILPVKLSAVSPDYPERIVWGANLLLTHEGDDRLRGFGSTLAEDDQILISSGGRPLSISRSGWLRQMVGVGEFASRRELVETLGGFAEVTEGTGKEVKLYSSEELETLRQTRKLIQQSERIQREAEEIQRLAAEGKISRAEMLKRLAESLAEAGEE